MMKWRDTRKDPPKPGQVIVARGDINTIIGTVSDRSYGGLMHGQLCIDGMWLNTGNSVTRIVAEMNGWIPAAEVLKMLEEECR